MSELTPCNYCTYGSFKTRMKMKHRGKKVKFKTTRKDGGLQVYYKVDDSVWTKAGMWFMALTDHCCC